MNNKKQLPEYKKINNIDHHNCFGCSPTNESGLQMKFYTDDESVFSDLFVPEHLCGWDNLVHGGVISSVLDEIMSWTAFYLLKKFILTKKMTVDFLRPVIVGKKLKAEGNIIEIKSDAEAIVQGSLYNEKGILCAKSEGIFATFTADTVRNLGFVNKNIISQFEEIIKHF